MTKPGSETRIEPEVVGPEDRLVIMVGSYGSGKTEVCVNLAVELARSGRKVQIADLDIVNPYFRCREAKQLAFADLPIVLPEIRGMINPPDGTLTIFDVGGDDVGARVLASLRTSIMAYELWQVVNSKRPFTDTLEGCIAMQHAVEKSSRLKITGVVANSHLIDQTTPSVVSEGWRLAQSVAAHSEIPVRCVAMMRELAESPQLETIGVPKLRMQRHMLPPWIQAGAELGDGSTPAAPPIPIGIPRYERGTDG